MYHIYAETFYCGKQTFGKSTGFVGIRAIAANHATFCGEGKNAFESGTKQLHDFFCNVLMDSSGFEPSTHIMFLLQLRK
jgi:hypothetical protein